MSARKCLATMAGTGVMASFAALGAADNVEKHLPFNLIVWMVGAHWAYEHLCQPEGGGGDE